MMFGKNRFDAAVADFEAAVLGRDARRSRKAFDRLQETFGQAAETELVEGAPRLAAVLPDVPPGPRAVVAVLVGGCVERGADAARCAPGVFAGLREALAAAEEFAAKRAAGGGDFAAAFPAPDGDGPDGESVAVAGEEAALGWWTLPDWERACVALLNDPGVRAALPDKGELLERVGRLEAESGHAFPFLTHALRVLDDEPLVVLHRPSRTGYALRMSGLGDTFQLHTLLADALVGGGHLDGRVPSPQEAAVCRDKQGEVPTVGAFNLVAPDGSWLGNEGTPQDIPVVDGVRLLVLDPPPYERTWPAGRLLPGMRGELVLERPLEPEEADRWFAHVDPPRTPDAG
ncbi:hypothetical protein [uncultured Streptomyces sp.]|uniref:hypothetical protein n=1 Tax=uncultured Streptomyces sp. TaxID=174707 RepID=UPI00262E6D68|nr:hypothetical protein [uncultured Streptomyces sp.]